MVGADTYTSPRTVVVSEAMLSIGSEAQMETDERAKNAKKSANLVSLSVILRIYVVHN